MSRIFIANTMSEVTIGNLKYSKEFSPAGSLMFSADFESGNLGRADMISSGEYDLFIRPDTCNPKQRVWFYFQCRNAVKDQKVIFNVVNFSKQRSLFEIGIAAPVVKNSKQTSWSRIPSKHVYYYRSGVHGDRAILSFAFVFGGKEPVEFAYCIPYTYTKLQQWLNGIESKNLPFVERGVLCDSVQRRRVDILTVSSDVFTTNSRKMIFITARVHPGETPSSYVIHGMILPSFLISMDPVAVQLREEYCFKIVPMLNPDGVYLGNYRSSVMGFDLNRHWRAPIEWCHPSIFAIKQLLTQYNNNPQTSIDLYIDLHAHSQKTNSFLYGNVNKAENSIRQLWLPHLLAKLSDDYCLDYTEFNTKTDKDGTGRRTMGDLLSTLCYTMEVSFFSYKPSGNTPAHTVPYLQFKYESLGEALAQAITQFAEVEKGEREVSLSRTYQTFVLKKPNKSFKEARVTFKTPPASTK